MRGKVQNGIIEIPKYIFSYNFYPINFKLDIVAIGVINWGYYLGKIAPFMS